MKKLIFSAFIATTLFVSSCGKDDDNGGGSTSLTGDWYLYKIYNDPNGYGSRWTNPNNCAEKTYWSISDKKIKHEWYYSKGSECKHTPKYYDYTATNGVFDMTVADDSPNERKGGKTSIKYEIKDKELILRFKNIRQQDEIQVLRKKGVNYSSLDPFIGRWIMTKATVGQTEATVKEGECLQGTVVSSSLGFSFYYKAPNQSGQCQETVETFKWVKEGNKYYDVTDPQNKEELALVFSENNTKLSYSKQSQNGLVTFYFTRVK